VFLPLRNVGAAFHSSAAGVTASSDAFDLLEAAREPRGNRADGALDAGQRASTSASASAGLVSDGLVIEGLTIRRGDRVVLDGFDLAAGRGEVVAVTGESGSGKSSLFAALLGFVDAAGRVMLDGRRVEPGDRSSIAWAGQAPVLLAGTIAENVRLGDEGADPAVLARALDLAGVELDPQRVLGPAGAGLSGGQAQRVATARAIHRLLARDGRLLLLDEPASAQDEDRELRLGRRLRELAVDGRIVLVATHRTGLVGVADQSIDLAVTHA
jgi:ATP-binding cassette subfamily C protein CydD